MARWLQSFLSSPALVGGGWKCGAAGDQRVQSRPSHQHQGTISPCSSAPPGLGLDAAQCWLDRGDQRPTQSQQSNLGLWGGGDEGSSSRDGSSLDNLPKDCHGMSLSPSEWLHSQSRHSSLHLLGAHPPVNAVTAGRDGTCGRRRQGLLRPPSSVRLRGKRSVWATGCLCARPPSRRLFVDAEIRQRRGQDLDNCPRLT